MMCTEWGFPDEEAMTWEEAEFLDMDKPEVDVVCKKCISD